MKKSYLLGIIVIAVAVAVIVSTAGDASTYVTFEEAAALSAEGDDRLIHVVGTLDKDAAGQPVGFEYRPEVDANYFAFRLVDQDGEKRRVVYRDVKPQDFERSEQVVIIGSFPEGQPDGAFVADKILMKCPSKYEETELTS
ncbi:MAG: cytochrome c maturation protein CcmE [Catalinimonas sp.]